MEKNIYFFGASAKFEKIYTEFYSELKGMKIKGIFDNDKNKWDTNILFWQILNPNDIEGNFDAKKDVILVTSSYYEDIKEQLNNIGLEEEVNFYDARKFLKAMKYHGNRVVCNCCQKEWDAFIYFGKPIGRHAECPACGTHERHRLLWKYMKDSYFPQCGGRRLKVLHMAPEKQIGKLLKNMDYIEYISADKYKEDVSVKADITNLKFEDNSFDLIICNHVLEHIIDDIKAMSELYRVLKPSGTAFLLVPLNYNNAISYEDYTITSAEEREIHFGQHDHVRRYGLDYFDRLQQVGFKTTKIHRDDIVPKEQQQMYGVELSEPVIFGMK